MEDDEEEYDNIPDWAQYGGFADSTTGEADGGVQLGGGKGR
jgi:hypothetical protein